MKIGTLRHLASFYNAGTLDAFGSGRSTGTLAFTDYVDPQPVTGRDLAANKLYAEIDYKLVMRYRGNIKAMVNEGMTVVLRGVTYDIKAVINEDERDKKLVVLCRRLNG